MSTTRRIIALAIAALLLLTFLDRFVLVELLARRTALSIFAALIEALAVIGAGYVARKPRGDVVLNFVIGYPIFGAICFLVGLLKVNRLTMGGAVALFAAGGIYSLWQHRGRIDGMSWPAIAILLLGFIAAQAPPSTLDELAYHLAVPRAWVNEGRAIELPLISHSYFPLGIESADLPSLAILGPLRGGTTSHFLHLLAAIATTILIQRRTRDALLTAAIVTTPALALTAGWSLVDWPLLGICVAMLDDDEVTPALAAGLLAKYTFIPFALVVLLVKRRFKDIWPGVLGGSVFFIRNLILTGNPFAPFFTIDAPHVGGFRELTLGSYIFDGRFIDESLGASLLASLPTITGLLSVSLLGVGVLLWVLAPSARILIPFFASAATHARLEWRWQRVVVAIAVVAQLFLAVYFADRSDAFSLLSGQSGDFQYLMKARASFESIQGIDGAVPAASRTLVVGLNETFWFERRVRGGGNFDGPRVSRYLETPTPEALRERLRRDGITHVAVVSIAAPTNVAQKKEERQTTLSPAAQKSLAQLLDRYATNVDAGGNATVFTLR